MDILQRGKPYPFHNRANGQERAVLERNAGFFDVLYYSTLAREDADTWNTGALRFGLNEPTPGVPFILFELPGNWQFDVSLNLRLAETATDEWLTGEGNTITLFLLDAKTNVIRGMRLISVPPGWAAELRAIGRRQLDRFPTSADVIRAIRAQETISLDLMIRTTQMLQAG